jgi:hypothetical protein
VCSPCITIQERVTQHLLVGLGPPWSEHRQYAFSATSPCRGRALRRIRPSWWGTTTVAARSVVAWRFQPTEGDDVPAGGYLLLVARCTLWPRQVRRSGARRWMGSAVGDGAWHGGGRGAARADDALASRVWEASSGRTDGRPYLSIIKTGAISEKGW